MSIKKYKIDISDLTIEIIRKKIKHLNIGVYPPDGRIRVSAPLHFTDDAIRLAVITRLNWIKKKREGFLKQIRESKREMISGESHYVEGRKYRLLIIEDTKRRRPFISLISSKTLQMIVPPKTDRDKREKILEQWYRKKLKEKLPVLIEKWENKIGVEISEVRIKKMKTKWGSCNKNAKRIWINLELAKKPASCLEYIIVHEMIHILEPKHNEHFFQLMNQFLPNWRLIRDELNSAPLGFAEWKY